VVEATAEAPLGDPRALLKIDCAEFQHGHDIAKLIGSPPGYLRHRETHPLLSQEVLNQYHRDKVKISFLLFDEIEKAGETHRRRSGTRALPHPALLAFLFSAGPWIRSAALP
jgi:ATP-dependent Clp protease ATP-binding subunit ClpB